MEQLCLSTAVEAAANLEADTTIKSPITNKEANEVCPKIKTEPLEATGPVQGGAQVTTEALASLEDLHISPLETDEVMCPLGRIKSEETPLGDAQQPPWSDNKASSQS